MATFSFIKNTLLIQYASTIKIQDFLCLGFFNVLGRFRAKLKKSQNIIYYQMTLATCALHRENLNRIE